ncbi:MAG: hypothetical protein O2914_07160 [Bacteroidetes bacterium]|jgi:hypothetical protein|nr:hypothetical protein [Bacteroidota bacterium]MDA0938594.1 hypothetical protein [Bacteroidota bacterium]MDA1344985.1 hypothetical protein [Bacteroidota bacterium]
MIFRIRTILDVKEDVFRDIEIEASATLEELHDAITQAFGFAGNEMASFYQSNEDWEQGEEIPLVDFDASGSPMGDTPLQEVFTADCHHLIYIYDFLALWTFYVELMEMAEPLAGASYPNLIFAQGEVPEVAPDKKFEADEDQATPEDFDFDEDQDEDEDYFESDYDDSYY